MFPSSAGARLRDPAAVRVVEPGSTPVANVDACRAFFFTVEFLLMNNLNDCSDVHSSGIILNYSGAWTRNGSQEAFRGSYRAFDCVCRNATNTNSR